MLVLAAHFEGGGALHVMEQLDPLETVLAALRERDAFSEE